MTARSILLNTDTITAKEAKALGLVTGIISPENFASECILAAKQMGQTSLTTIQSTKCLTYRFQDELDNYFNAERQMMDTGCSP